MWILKNAKDESLHLIPGEHVVGRKNCEIVLCNDQSISRRHAVIVVTHPQKHWSDPSKIPHVEVADDGSKYGTTLQSGNRTVKLQKDVKHTLKQGDEIHFGLLENKWKLCFEPLVVVVSALPKSEKNKVKSVVGGIGGHVVSEWVAETSHLTMSSVTMTVKAISALAYGKPIVTPEFWVSYKNAIDSRTNLPNYEDYIPPLGEAVLNRHKVSFIVNPKRKSLFQGKVFYFFSEPQYKDHGCLVVAAGGESKLVDDLPQSMKQFVQMNSVVMQLLTMNSQSMSLSQAPEEFAKVAVYLKEQGKRLIPASEIGLAVLHCSVEKYCNPDFNFANVFSNRVLGNSQPSEQGQILATETQTQNADPDEIVNEKRIIPDSGTESKITNSQCSVIEGNTDDVSKMQEVKSHPKSQRIRTLNSFESQSQVLSSIQSDTRSSKMKRTRIDESDDECEIIPPQKHRYMARVIPSTDGSSEVSHSASGAVNASCSTSRLNISVVSEPKGSNNADDLFDDFQDYKPKLHSTTAIVRETVEEMNTDDLFDDFQEEVKPLKSVDVEKQGNKVRTMLKFSPKPVTSTVCKRNLSSDDESRPPEKKITKLDTTKPTVKQDELLQDEDDIHFISVGSLKKEDSFASRLHNVTVLLKPLMVSRNSTSLTSSHSSVNDSGVVNFKKFRKVNSLNSVIVPRIIGGSDLEPYRNKTANASLHPVSHNCESDDEEEDRNWVNNFWAPHTKGSKGRIGQHKNEHKSVVVNNAYSSQRTSRMVIKNPKQPGDDLPSQLPAHRRVLLGKASLRVSVANDRPSRVPPPPRLPPPMSCRSLDAVATAPPPPSSSRSVHVNPSFLAKGKVAHEGAVHVNPNFFKATRDAGAVAPTLMCKSVHINPRLLRAGGGATIVTGPDGAAPMETTPVPAVRKEAAEASVVHPAAPFSNKPLASLVCGGNRLPTKEKLSGKQTQAQKEEKCAGTRGLQITLKAPSDIVAARVPAVRTKAPSQSSVLTSDLRIHQTSSPLRRLPSSPARTPSSRRKYAFRSKTKLVKAPGSSGRVSRTTPHGSTLLSLSRTKLVRLPGRSRRVSTSRAETTPVQTRSVSLRAMKAAHGTTLMSLSRTKLVRMPEQTSGAPTLKSASSTTALNSPVALPVGPTTTVTKTRYRLLRTSLSSSHSPTVRLARKVSTKYKFRSSSIAAANTTFRLDHRTGRTTVTPTTRRMSGSRFKVDHRATTTSGKVSGHLLLSPLRRTTYSAFSNRVWAASPKLTLSYKRLSRIGNNPGSRNNRQDSALVRIGGLLYKSSRNKLILSKTPAKAITPNSRPRTVVKRRLSMGGQVVYVRGDKFVMDRSGKTMQRIAQDSGSSSLNSSHGKRKRCVSRVDIGGMTYIQKSPNVLVRTNIHRARNVVSNAKQKSIAFLAKKMRKINTPCLFFRRFGRCPRQEKGRCEHVHDPKCIDICKKFLQGNCRVEGCLLSHNVGPEKMPTCRFFLEACCVKVNCPYLHVKVSDRAPICRNFLQGYCADGPECLKRHILLCPEFDEKGSCSKGKCPFPHNIAPLHSRATCSDLPITKLKAEEDSDSALHSKRKRYYETDSVIEDLPQDTQSDESSDEEATHFEEVAADSKMDDSTPRKRPKIGDLPSFIALE